MGSWTIEQLRTLRDELRVQASLGAAEVRDLWSSAEEKFHEIEAQARRLGERAEKDLEERAGELMDEAAELYEKVRDRLEKLRSH